MWQLGENMKKKKKKGSYVLYDYIERTLRDAKKMQMDVFQVANFSSL